VVAQEEKKYSKTALNVKDGYMNFEERHIDVEGHSVRYLTAGEGPPLVLLHGVGTSSGEWSWVLPDLARNNLVYAIDLPGYDGSYEPPDYSPAYTASFVSSFLDAVGVERAVIVGNSFGGLVALHLALSHPARVSALVLSDSAGLGQAVNPALVALNSPAGGPARREPGASRACTRRAAQKALYLRTVSNTSRKPAKHPSLPPDKITHSTNRTPVATLRG
jgi:pimeloyl-ACP methyl ester carboxylesterase